MTSIQSDLTSNAILTLRPPFIPGSAAPVVGADIGIPLHIYDLPPMGLKVDVPPYLDQVGGENVSLNLNELVNIVSKKTADESSTTTLYLPKEMLLTGRVNTLTYTVTRATQIPETSEPPLELLYNAVRPGNVDRSSGGGDGHSELELILPDEIKNGVGPDFPVAGVQVCVSYPYCRAYDVIWLNCNGHSVSHTVTPSEAPPPPDPGSDTPIRVCLTVTRADLEQAKDHPEFIFAYTVTDQLNNTPDPNNPWSSPQIVDVDLAGIRLVAPILREILDDADDDPSIIDLEKMGSNDLNVIILTGDSRFQKGDSIDVTYIAKLTGQPDVVVPVSGVVEADPFGQKKPCLLTVPNDKVPANSTVQVSYQLTRGGSLIATSRTAHARVIGVGLPDLLEPSLIKSAGGMFDPLDPANLQGAIGRVEVLGYHPGDTVQLIVNGAPGAGSPTFQPKPLNNNTRSASGRADFALDNAFTAANMDKEVKLRYALFRNGTSHDSRTLSVFISKIPDNHPNLPTPAIDGVAGNELDVNKLQASDLLRVSGWPHQVSGQPVWLRYEGVNASGTVVAHDDRRGEPHTTVPGFTYPVPLDWLKTLKHGSEVRIIFRVNHDGVADTATATRFPVRTYIVKLKKELVLLAPTVLEADSLNDTLNLVKPVSAVQVKVEYEGMGIGDQVTMYWQGTAGAGTTQQTKYVSAIAPLKFVVDNSNITPNHNRTVSIYYEVVQSGQTEPEPSELLVLTIQNLSLVGDVVVNPDSIPPATFYCSLPVSQITIPADLPIGRSLFQTPPVLPDRSVVFNTIGTPPSSYKINVFGPQPRSDSRLFPTNVTGIFASFFASGRLPLTAGPTLLPPGGYGFNYPLEVEFVKMGPIEDGTIIDANSLRIMWEFGDKRLLLMMLRLQGSITINVR